MAIILDTDIGTNPDDYFALLMLLNFTNEPLLIVTGNRYPVERACMVKKILDLDNKKDIVLCSGEQQGSVEFFGTEYMSESTEGIRLDYVKEIETFLSIYKKAVYINIQGCSNLAQLIKIHPEYKDILSIYHMGMSTINSKEFISGGTNMEADPQAAKFVYESGLNLKVVGLQTTLNDALRVNPETPLYKKLESSSLTCHQLLLEHLLEFKQRRNVWPALHDPLTVAVALGKDFVEFENIQVEFNELGMYRTGSGPIEITTSKPHPNASAFMQFCELVI